jgi:hypothetical protein
MNPDAGGNFAGNPFTWPQAASGAQYVDIGNVSSYALSQSFALASAGTYLLSWWDNTGVTNVQSSPYSVSIVDATNSSVYGASFNAYHSGGAWLQRTAMLNLGVGAYTLAFISTGVPNGLDTLVDATSITTAVPEPNTALMMFVGLAMGLLIVRRRA